MLATAAVSRAAADATAAAQQGVSVGAARGCGCRTAAPEAQQDASESARKTLESRSAAPEAGRR